MNFTVIARSFIATKQSVEDNRNNKDFTKMEISKTPEPPYYAVIFTSQKTDSDDGYNKMSQRMLELVEQQPGFLGFESAKDGIGITISYWENLESIKNWKENAEHVLAQNSGKERWYKSYKVRICKVERDYRFEQKE